jgi:hypothetical protein
MNLTLAVLQIVLCGPTISVVEDGEMENSKNIPRKMSEYKMAISLYPFKKSIPFGEYARLHREEFEAMAN